MSTTILKVLQNSQKNLMSNKPLKAAILGKMQLRDAIILLRKGYSVYDEIEPILEKYGVIDENIPDKKQINHL